MPTKVDVAIIGAGTAGISAFKEAKKYTNKILIIDRGPLGTTCARVGCMPSKVLIQAANSFYERHLFESQGISGADCLKISIEATLAHVRKMRDHFTSGIVKYINSLGNQFICSEAQLLSPNIIKINNDTIFAKSIIIATGSYDGYPEEWRALGNKLLTSETIFEQQSISNIIGVIGAGSIGLELGQALSRMGVTISIFTSGAFVGGLSDPQVNKVAIQIFKDECSLYLNKEAQILHDNKGLFIRTNRKFAVNQILSAVGRKPNIDKLGLNKIDISLDQYGIPEYDKTTMKISNSSLFIAGDVNKYNPLLHEAADEGRIAAYNALNTTQCFQRRTPISIVFTDPNIVVVGRPFKDLDIADIVIGEVNFSNQGRAKIIQKNKGLLRIYGTKKNGLLLGAEMIAPQGEHLGHLLAWAIYKKLSAFDVLKMPFYHPVIEEGMRTALRNLAAQVDVKTSAFDLAMCDSEASPFLN